MRLVIHAGFGKCGSSAIQHALQNRQPALRRQSIYLFGKGLVLNRGILPSAVPFWKSAEFFLEARPGDSATIQIARELNRLADSVPNATAVLSAELLSQRRFARMFEGIDELFDATVVFYIRPQFEWIPSSWKQWRLKEAISLPDYVEDCLSVNRPHFLQRIDDWASALPKARTIVRLLPETVDESRGPASDFLSRILGLDGEARRVGDSRVNPSVDYAILHILSKNPWLFEGKQGNEPFKSLLNILPARYASTNIKMLSLGDEERIAAHFVEENRQILTRYCGLEASVAEDVYNRYFVPKAGGRAYGDVSELEIIHRGLGILLDTLLSVSHKKRVLRPPYWKVPWRIAKRFGWRHNGR